MRRLVRTGLLALALLALALPVASAQAEAKPVWGLHVTALPTNFPAPSTGTLFGGPAYLIVATNLGGADATGPVTLEDTLPSGVVPASVQGGCAFAAPQFSCSFAGPVGPGRSISLTLPLKIEAGVGAALLNKASVQSPGATGAQVEVTTPVSATPPPFGFVGPFSAPLSEEDGSPATGAGSHPYRLTAEMGFPTEKAGGSLGGAGHLRDTLIEFPPGELANPAVTPVLCTEAELTTEIPGCPEASQVGTIAITTVPAAGPEFKVVQLYNMVPPPGQAASLGFDALGVGVFVHLTGRVRSESDYGITGGTTDALALTQHPIFGAQVQLWGDPSAKSHDQARGACLETTEEDSCPVEESEKTNTAFLRNATRCSGAPQLSVARADSWEQPGAFAEAKYESAGLDGNAARLEGCEGLGFEPSIEAKPTTNLADSPSGLDFQLHLPQGMRLQGEGSEPVSDLEGAKVTLPEGLVINPAAAEGQGACTSAQIGLTTPVKVDPIHFTSGAPSCPDASKVGTLEAVTPLLAQFDPESGKVARDPVTGEPIPRPVKGSVYLAKPFDNPFGSLVAIYLVVEDPLSGTVAKLAVEVSPDLVSGRLTTQLSESPQLPVEDVRLHLFGGNRGALRTPIACGSYATGARLTPWSDLEASVEKQSSFATTAAPGGGTCPTAAASAPHRPGFVAGTLAPAAGAYSPLVMRLSREDDSQPLAGFEATLPPGLTAKLAGVPYCPEADIAKAQSRSNPEDGALELAQPSCPAASRIGSLDVGAGAGPTPLHTGGSLYLAGPYKGAPLSVVAITPAVAGPFDLGVVVVRSALYLDPETARPRAVSDPLPQILDGIPLDVRTVSLKIDRSQFSLNPTSCDPLSTVGTATSAFGQAASLQSPFQVGGCGALPYKPKLHLRLFGPTTRGAHPRLRAIFEAKPGEAGTARISLALPRSEFIDQAHFRTICTRVQFAAGQCPAGSVYGQAKVITPILDYPLEGPIYLRSSSHKLPDVVMALRGPAYQPLEIDLDGRVDSVNGGIRVTFEAVPDAPVKKAIVTMQGASKGLFQNSTNICRGTHRATLRLLGQNGKAANSKPPVKAKCSKAKKKKGK